MTAAIAFPGNTAFTFPTYLFASGPANSRSVPSGTVLPGT